MQKLRREKTFLERGMQGVRKRLNTIQGPLLTPTSSVTDIRPKWLMVSEYHDYFEND